MKPNHSKHVDTVIEKTLSNLLSIKFYVLLASTYFFYSGKLTEEGWKQIIMVVGGYRAVNEVAALLTSKKKAEPHS